MKTASQFIKTINLVAAFILILFSSAAMAKGAATIKNMNLEERFVKAEKNQVAMSFDRHASIATENSLVTRKKLVYFLESDPMNRKPAFDLSGGKPRCNIC